MTMIFLSWVCSNYVARNFTSVFLILFRVACRACTIASRVNRSRFPRTTAMIWRTPSSIQTRKAGCGSKVCCLRIWFNVAACSLVLSRFCSWKDWKVLQNDGELRSGKGSSNQEIDLTYISEAKTLNLSPPGKRWTLVMMWKIMRKMWRVHSHYMNNGVHEIVASEWLSSMLSV